MNRDAIHRHIDAHLDEHIEHVQRWVQQPSVSWDDGPGVRACALLTPAGPDIGFVFTRRFSFAQAQADFSGG